MGVRRENKMKKRIKIKGRLRIYLQASLILGILLTFLNIAIYLLDFQSGLLLTCFLIFYFTVIFALMFYNKPIIMNELISFATQYGQIQKKLLRELDMPYALLDESGKVNTAHTTNPVPFAVCKAGIELKDGRLADIAPTILNLMGLAKPAEMTGECLIK